jgi:farnesyl-diphosphate farnesyltransferase
MNQEKYLEAQMNAVSRSFTFVVSSLEQPLRTQFATAYLLCRAADNIEDCTAPRDQKAARFAEFAGLLAEPAEAPAVLAAWDAAPWPGLTDDERKLMGANGGGELWRIYAAIPPAERAIIRRWVAAMAEGMMHLEDPDQAPRFVDAGNVKVLASQADYDRYCYIVAGTVGYMTTELAMHRYGINGNRGRRLLDASEACGRALQKTNILKDFAEDLTRGVCYLPDAWLQLADRSPLAFGGGTPELKRILFDDLLADLEVLTQYVLDLPLEARDFRLAVLLCLLPALQTNLLAAKETDRLFTAKHDYKISRVTQAQCMADARRMAGDNTQIAEYSGKARAEISRQATSQGR